MQRISSAPRAGWQDILREQALVYAEADVPQALRRWDESACYVLALSEVRALEAATEELHGLCVAAARHVVTNARWAEFGIPDWAAPAVRRSLASGAPSLYGCLDLWYDGRSPPKLLEYRAETPPALVEAAICQWYWLEQTRPDEDQWNQLHERLVAGWHAVANRLSEKTVHCGWADLDTVGTDRLAVGYLAETARQAGLTVQLLPMREIGWNGTRFVDGAGEPPVRGEVVVRRRQVGVMVDGDRVLAEPARRLDHQRHRKLALVEVPAELVAFLVDRDVAAVERIGAAVQPILLQARRDETDHPVPLVDAPHAEVRR